jgi:hypothetical protein
MKIKKPNKIYNTATLIVILNGYRNTGFEIEEMTITRATTTEEVKNFLEKFRYNGGWKELKIVFSTKIRGIAGGETWWVMDQIRNQDNWRTDWTCHVCKKHFDNLDDCLTDEQMEMINERFAWTCPDCFRKRVLFLVNNPMEHRGWTPHADLIEYAKNNKWI